MRGLGLALLLAAVTACGDEQPEAPSLSVRVYTPCEDAQLLGFVYGWMIPLDGEKEWSAKDLREWGSLRSAPGPDPVLRWTGQKPGRYLLGFSHRRGASWDVLPAQVVEWDGGSEPIEVELPEPVAPRWLSVRALDPTGAVLTDVRWTIRQHTRGRTSVTSTAGLRRSDGVVLLYIGDPATFGPGRYTVEARVPKWGARTVDFFPGSSDVVDLVFVEQLRVTGFVEDYVGSGYEGRVAVVVAEADFNRTGRSSSVSFLEVESDGRFQLPPQQPGPCALALYVRVGESKYGVVGGERVQIRADGETVRVRLPKLHRIRATHHANFRGRISIMPIRLTEGDSRELASEPDSHSVVFDGLPAGRYRISWGQEFVDVVIPAVSEIALR